MSGVLRYQAYRQMDGTYRVLQQSRRYLSMVPMSHTAPTQFGQRIAELRRGRRWSQEHLARRARLHRSYVGRVERGEQNVSLETIARLAHAFGLKISQLFTGLDI